MIITSCTEPRWGNPEHTQIVCRVTFAGSGEVFPFAAMADDHQPHGRNLWQRLNAREFGQIGDYVARKLDAGAPVSPKVLDPK
ncbi:MAG TPA: hypothetical protein VGP48_06695 [Stellaceae bacterium]|jgi:hypothetical protein|nr:hypothetical protein [Stellaceae bacterium]